MATYGATSGERGGFIILGLSGHATPLNASIVGHDHSGPHCGDFKANVWGVALVYDLTTLSR